MTHKLAKPVTPFVLLDEATHTYTVNGAEVAGVTRVLDSVLQEFVGIDPDVLKKAQDRGTAVHKATELYDLGTLDFTTLDETVAPFLSSYLDFLADTGFQPLAIEPIVVSARYGYAGTLDRLGPAPRAKRRWLLDIKTPKVIRRAVGPQLAAYEQAARETGLIEPKEIIERYALQLFEDKYKLISQKNPGDLNVFQAALILYRFKQGAGA